MTRPVPDGSRSPRAVASHRSSDHRRAIEVERIELVGRIAADLLMGDRDPDEIVRRAFEQLAEHLGLEVYVNYLIDHEEQGLRLQACAGVDADAARQLEWLDFGQAVCGTVARDGRNRVVEHVLESNDPLTDFIRALGLRAYACHALMARGRIIGTLSFGTRSRDAFDPDELELMRTVSDLVAAVFDRAALLQDAQARAGALDDIARFQSLLLDSMSQSVIATDNNGRVTAWNRRAEELYGWSSDEAVERFVYDLTVPEANQEQAQEIMAALARGESWSGEFHARRKDGSTALVRVRNAPLLDPNGRPFGVIGISEDITEERRREAAAREEQERRAQWFAFTSHELRSPLTSIVGYATRLRRHAERSEQLAGVRQEVEMLEEEARRMERSVELVLKVAALDVGNISLDREPIYLADLVHEEIDALSRRTPHARIEARGFDADLTLMSDGEAIRLILRNLVENGTKYGGDPPVVIVEAGMSRDRQASLTVGDNGRGISESDLPRVFDRYYRGDTGGPSPPGLGLGLYISRQLAELLGGTLVAESKIGEGARFRLTIPTNQS